MSTSSSIGGEILGITIAVVLIICAMASAYFLNHIRDILRELLKTQKALAQKLGVRT